MLNFITISVPLLLAYHPPFESYIWGFLYLSILSFIRSWLLMIEVVKLLRVPGVMVRSTMNF